MRGRIKFCFCTFFLACTIPFYSQEVAAEASEFALMRYYNEKFRYEAFASAFFFRDQAIYVKGLEDIIEKDITGDAKEMRRWISQRLPKGKRLLPHKRLTEQQKWLIDRALKTYYLKPNEIYFVAFCEGENTKVTFFSFVTIPSANSEAEPISMNEPPTVNEPIAVAILADMASDATITDGTYMDAAITDETFLDASFMDENFLEDGILDESETFEPYENNFDLTTTEFEHLSFRLEDYNLINNYAKFFGLEALKESLIPPSR